MEQELSESLVNALDEVFKKAGADGFEHGMRQLKGWLEAGLALITLVETKEKLLAAVEVAETNKGITAPFLIATARFMPELFAMSLADLANMAVKEFGNSPGGRRKTEYEIKLAIINDMSDLSKRGYSLAVAKRNTALKYGVSQRTAERAWQQRGPLQEGARDLNLVETKDWFRKLLHSGMEGIKKDVTVINAER
jgi:hypothetical protein